MNQGHVAELAFKGHTYRFAKMDVMTQFHVSRRIAPILAAAGVRGYQIMRTLMAAQDGKAVSDEDPRVVGSMLELAPVMAEILSKMTDEDCNYVIHACMKITHRVEQDGRTQQVMSGTGFMYDDIDMDAMLRLLIEALKPNMGGFLKGPGGSTPSPGP